MTNHTEPSAERVEASADDVLPCPFCGHVGLSFADGSTYRWGLASCEGCGATSGEVRRSYPDNGEWHAKAVKQWNTRAVLAAAPEATKSAASDLPSAESVCSTDPRAPHGFDRNASHNEGRYVCECESWSPEPAAPQGEREAFEKLIPHIGGMTHFHIFQAGAEYARAAPAATPAPVSAVVPLTPGDREALRQRVMAEMDKRMPTITKKFHDWNGWPGTWTFADVAVSALQDHLIAHGIGQGKESSK